MAQEKKGKKKNAKGEENKNNVTISQMFVLGLAELVGTAMLLFLGCMGCVTAIDNMPIPHQLPAITFGLVIMLIIQLFGHISGAHLNPSVTIATVILGYLKPILAPIYIFAQFVGAIIGFGLLKLLIPHEYTDTEIFNPDTNQTEHRMGICTTGLHPKMTTMQALALEIVITAILILVCCAVWDKRNVRNTDSLPLRFGLIVSAIAIVTGPYTGASMNTPRSFAPALFNNDWDDHWIYWVGPPIGAIVGTYFYKIVFSLAEEDLKSEQEYAMEDMPLNQNHLEQSNKV